jgi:hypothetical protein
MQAYEISKDVDVASTYAGDLAAVRAIVRTLPRELRLTARIHLREFPSNKAAFVQLLNGRPLEGPIKRTWRPGRRGGALTEIPADE